MDVPDQEPISENIRDTEKSLPKASRTKELVPKLREFEFPSFS